MSISTKAKKVGRFFGNTSLYKDFVHNLLSYSRLKESPIIICGCPRSGTTLLMSILDSHADINVIPFETAVLQKRPKEKRFFKNKWLHFTFMKLQLFGYLFSMRIKPTSVRWCEKTPLNILNIKEINQLFKGKVRFINIIRDGRAVVSSYHRRFGYMVKPALWHSCVTAGIENESMSNLHSVRYEDIIQNTEMALQGIQNFLNLKKAFSVNWFEETAVKGNIKNLENGKIEGSLITKETDVSRLDNWKNSSSPFLHEFLSNEKYMRLNKRLGYE
jgi:hypothetical protein